MKKAKLEEKDIVEEARDFLKEAEDHEDKNRANYKADVRFSRLSEQWPNEGADSIQQKREREGRPCLTFNRLNAVIRQVVNDGRLNRPQVKVVAVDDKGDKEVADVYSGIIKNIETQSNADAAYDTGIDNAVSGGWGYLTVDIDYIDDESFEQDIRINRVPDPLCIYGDPHSEAVDSSDWEQAIEIKKIPREKFEKLYPNADQTDFQAEEWGNVSESWLDTDSVTIAKYWKRVRSERQIIGLSDGSVVDVSEYENEKEAYLEAGVVPATQPRGVPSYKVSCHTVSGVEELSTKEWIGKYIPIVPIYGDEVWEGGERHLRSLIHDAIDSNRMYNYWRSAETELVALAPRVPFVGRKGAFKDPKWSQINDSSIPFVEFDGPDRPVREPGPQVPAGMTQQALTAADDIKSITGIYDASLGARSNETSGVAINARKVEGEVSTFHFQDNLTRAIRHLGLILIDLIPKVYSTERMIRVIGEDGEADIVAVNQEVEDPETRAVLKVNDLTAGKYDVAVSAGPSFTTRRAEAAEQMMDLVRAYPDAAPIIGDLLAKNLDWPGSDEIADRLKKILPEELRTDEDGEEQELPPEMTQMIEQMQQALQEASAKIQELESGEQEKVLKQLNEKKKLEISEYDAETKRITATSENMSPEQMQTMILQTIGDILDTPDEIPEMESVFAGQVEGQPEPMPAI